MDRVGRPEPIIDIDDGNSWGTGVEHSKQGGNSFEMGSVSDRGRYSDQGCADESTQNTR